MKQRCAHWLVGLANGTGGGSGTLENGSFDDPPAKSRLNFFVYFVQFDSALTIK